MVEAEKVEKKVEEVKEDSDEALGEELVLDGNGSESDNSSVYSDLEGEDDDDSEDDEDSEKDLDSEVEDDGSSEDDEEESKDKAVTKAAAAAQDEYEAGDSSDEEDIRNTIGNIPVNWYDEYGHIGYDLDGKKIRKPKRGDELERFLSRMENPEHGVTVEDPATGQQVVLSEADAALVKRAQQNKVPQPGYNLYEDQVEWFSSDVMEMPLRSYNESKKSFLPSLHEKQKVGKMVHAIKMGWMKPRPAKKADGEADTGPKYYMLWQTDDQVEEAMRRVHDPIPAPKMWLPGHEESYNPPPEYLFTDKEKKEWTRATNEGHKRKLPFIPQKFASLRQVPAWDNFIRERFERCLDLYLAPRQRKMRLTIQPEDLVPNLPKPQDLQPFPTVCRYDVFPTCQLDPLSSA